jgi:regulator of RNase E activity RraA
MIDCKELSLFTTPTIANAIESFGVRPRLEGVTDSRIRCLFPQFGVVVGYAVTAVIHSGCPAEQPRSVQRRSYWEHVRSSAQPSINIVQDLAPVPSGAYWGEINASLHKALGSQGVITDGTVRDVDDVERTGFHFFASGVQVSHGYAHLEDFGGEVEVFGMKVANGDLIHADRHGAVVIPAGIAARVAEAARRVVEMEKPLLEACTLENPIDELDRLISPEY